MKPTLRHPSRQGLAAGASRALDRFVARQATSRPLLVNPFAIGYSAPFETARRGEPKRPGGPEKRS